jgi:hypothetical protein
VRPLPAFLIIPAMMIVLPAQETSASQKKMTDAQAEAFARQAITLQNAADQKAALAVLRGHRFKSIRIPEREFVLYAQGLLEDRLGDSLKAAATFRKLEVTWPQSPYLAEVQTVLALQSIERRRFPEAEKRLRKALESDIPVESKRRTQELLLWTLSEQGRLAEGMPIVKTLHPLGTSKPSERGLVAILEVYCLAGEKDSAKAVRSDLQMLYPASKYTSRADLAWARLLGTTGDAAGSAETLRTIIAKDKDTPEADEARLALAALLSDGKLHPKEAETYPAPQKLLEQIRKSDRKGDKAQKALLVELRLHMNQAEWKQAVDTTTKLLAGRLDAEETTQITELRNQALRSWTQQLLDKKSLDPLLPYLDRATLAALSKEQRLFLAKTMAQLGLPEGAQQIVSLAPAAEKPALIRAIADAANPESNPQELLKLLPTQGGSPQQNLRRAQALIALKRWGEASGALSQAQPGPDRIAALRTLLQRPMEKRESPLSRLKEAEGWWGRLPERGTDREPIAILVADLRAQAGDWKGALALYPAECQKENQGWVALMRATCQLRLGQKDAAKATLKTAVDESDFKMERQTLGKQLGL